MGNKIFENTKAMDPINILLNAATTKLKWVEELRKLKKGARSK
jgi:hypothetical protein